LTSRLSKISITLGELAERVKANLDGNGGISIKGAAPVNKAVDGDITFIANVKYLMHLESTRASAVVLDKDTTCPNPNISVLRSPNPYLTFASIIDILYPELPDVPSGIDPSAVVGQNCQIAENSRIGALCHIKNGAKIGSNTRLISSVFVGTNVTIGANCLIYPGVCLLDDTIIGDNVIIHSSTVLGSDGFGFAESDSGLKKIKQIGWVEIGNDVEIGSNCSIDRGALGSTRIGNGTKIDNLVQIAHNVEIGQHSIIVAQVGIAGSAKIGNGVILAGQSGVVGHIELSDGVKVGAQSGIGKSIPAGKTVLGSPARDIVEAKRIEASLTRLPDLFKRVRKLEKK